MRRRLVDVLGRTLHPGGGGPAKRPSPRSHAVLCCAVATMLIGVGVGPASANGVRFTDPTGDMAAFNETGDEGVTVTPAPNHRAGDVKSAKVRHGRRAVTLRFAFAQLRQSHFNALFGQLRTGAVVRNYYVEDARNARPRLYVVNKRFETVCGSATLDVDYRANTLTIQMPRKCLKRPDWVEATAMSFNDPPKGPTFYGDDAFSATPIEAGEHRPTWSARVYGC